MIMFWLLGNTVGNHLLKEENIAVPCLEKAEKSSTSSNQLTDVSKFIV